MFWKVEDGILSYFLEIMSALQKRNLKKKREVEAESDCERGREYKRGIERSRSWKWLWERYGI